MNRARSAAALVMALLILVGLMLLGLPFLFSQSVSRAGSATVAARQAAHIYNSSSINLGLGLAIYTQENYRGVNLGTPDNVTWTDLTTSLPGGVLRTDGSPLADVALDPQAIPAVIAPAATNQITVLARGLDSAAADALSWNADGQRVRTSLKLEDESGKIDGNSLGPLGWAEVLKVAGIEDKDITTSPGSAPDAIDATAYPHLNPTGTYWIFANLSSAGQLADAIALRRIRNGPYHRIEDLALVDPQATGFNFDDPRQSVGGPPLYRTGLTPAELDLLRPFISFSTPGPGRRGFADFGNQSANDGLDNSVYPDLSEGILSDDLIIGSLHAWGIINSHLTGTQLHVNLMAVGTMSLQVGDGLTFQLPAPINLNQTTPKTREALGLTIDPGALPRKSWLPTDDTGLLLWRDIFLSGTTARNRFHPPIGLSSLGIVRVSSQAAVTVPTRGGLSERTVAQEARTLIAQALPQQQGTINVQWRNQAELQDLVMSHAGSRVATQPARTVLHTVTAAVSPAPPTITTSMRPGSYDLDDPAQKWFRRPGLRPGKLKNFGDYTTAPSWLPANDWLTLPDPASWSLDPASDQVIADGFVTGTTPISVPFSTANPLVLWETNGRHLSFWVCATEELTQKTRLLEVGNGTSERNSLRLTWDPVSQLLVLRLTNPAFPDTFRYRPAEDDPLTQVNENALGWHADPVNTTGLLPASQETVLAKYLGNQAFKPGRWHHLQLAIGNGTPGSICLMVDGLVGRDLSRTISVTDDQPGDYALLPCAILKTPLANADNATLASTEGLLEPKNATAGNTLPIQLAVSGFWTKHLVNEVTIDSLFPAGGNLRIGREYLHYEDMATNGTIKRYWRGVRQDSISDNATSGIQYPRLEAHPAGSLVMPGGFSVTNDSAIAFRNGKATMIDRPGDNTWVIGTGKVTNLIAAPAVNDHLAMTRTPGTTWPVRGIMTLQGGYYEFSFDGSDLVVLREIQPAVGTFLATSSYDVRVISLAAQPPAQPTDSDWGSNDLLSGTHFQRRLQLSDADMAQVEWITYDATATGAGIFYFIKFNGDFRVENRSRTPIIDWTGATAVIARPVQNFPRASTVSEWFRPGDHLSYRDDQSTWRDLVIRYVTIDHHEVPGTTAYDTVNGEFTVLDRADLLPANGHNWVVGQGWSPQDGPYVSATLPAVLPKKVLATQGEWSDSTTLTLGGPGANNTSETTPPSSPPSALPSTLSTVPLLIDGFASGALHGGYIGIPSMPTAPLGAAVAAPLFDFSTALGRKPMSIVLVDGEAMAYHIDNNGKMAVDGRGLLGSEANNHGNVAPDASHPWSILLLPTGPVRQFGTYDGETTGMPAFHATGAENWVPVVEDPDHPTSYWTGSGDDPSSLLLTDTSTTIPTYHGIHLIGPNSRGSTALNPYPHTSKWACPTWLQGLWGTDAPPATTTRSPLLIGWFPRFPSLMPQSTPPAEAFRSRIYAWASFPVRLPRLRLPSPITTPANLPINIIPGLTSPTTQSRIMAGAVNGNDQAPGCLRDLLASSPFSDWHARPAITQLQPVPGDSNRFLAAPNQLLNDSKLVSTSGTASVPAVPRDLDGFEVRVTWHYDATATSLSDIADHMNTTPPAIGTPVKLPVQAPVTVLATE